MKTIKIIQLIIFILAAVFLIGLLCMFIFNKINFSQMFRQEAQIELLSQIEDVKEISKISLDMCSADIIINPSDTDEISINYRGPKSLQENLDLTVTVSGGELVIKQNYNQQNFFFWSWNLTPRVLEITLPESYADDLNIGNTSGDLSITGNYRLNSFATHLTSGDVSLSDIECSGFSLESTSGDVELGRIDTSKLSISLTSGQIEAKELTGTGTIGSFSGDIRIDNLIGDVKISATSGEIIIGSLSGSGSVSCSSGDISINVAESTGNLLVKASSGNIDLGFGAAAAYEFDAHCTSGDVSANFPVTYAGDNNTASGQIGTEPYNNLDVKTTSGDIDLAA